ncbi:unnamed protein product [Trichogramma brassicae]|uniref:YjeF N-terminal domain-containing protein n=1 Tax=Trichogramma brassicae TaxID=86971 RepID=A0A6H5IQU7_9HYME|nr:unnamed protein product [Trichogramma brassicae]
MENIVEQSRRKKMTDRDENTFGTPIDQSLHQDFDFEKNLALFNKEVELLGRAGTEISLQLLGGAHRLSPHNAHQWPTVVALCGPHRSGAAGINCARQLSSHGVKTIVYVESSEDIFLLQELSLYRYTGNRVEVDVKKLPSAVDLIILALYEEKSPRSIPAVAKWANNNRASVLAIEPPATGTPGIVSKYSLVSALPLSHCADNAISHTFYKRDCPRCIRESRGSASKYTFE